VRAIRERDEEQAQRNAAWVDVSVIRTAEEFPPMNVRKFTQTQKVGKG
jgi:hypothetical protein